MNTPGIQITWANVQSVYPGQVVNFVKMINNLGEDDTVIFNWQLWHDNEHNMQGSETNGLELTMPVDGERQSYSLRVETYKNEVHLSTKVYALTVISITDLTIGGLTSHPVSQNLMIQVTNWSPGATAVSLPDKSAVIAQQYLQYAAVMVGPDFLRRYQICVYIPRTLENTGLRIFVESHQFQIEIIWNSDGRASFVIPEGLVEKHGFTITARDIYIVQPPLKPVQEE